jgi:hypothetical protein
VCPNDSLNDADADQLCADADNCPTWQMPFRRTRTETASAYLRSTANRAADPLGDKVRFISFTVPASSTAPMLPRRAFASYQLHHVNPRTPAVLRVHLHRLKVKFAGSARRRRTSNLPRTRRSFSLRRCNAHRTIRIGAQSA